jgi:hypothetical protein
LKNDNSRADAVKKSQFLTQMRKDTEPGQNAFHIKPIDFSAKIAIVISMLLELVDGNEGSNCAG